MTSVHLLLGGDVCPVHRYEPLFREGSQLQILGALSSWAQSADLFVANLECPLIQEPTPILKTGPVLGVPVGCAHGLKAMGLHAVGLANNHILDHGATGLKATLEACSAMGIATFGAGAALPEAQRILVRDVQGLRVGLLAMAEREWSLATPTEPGANPLSVIDFVRQMRACRKELDYLVVLLHAGCEGYELPSPGLRKVCRFLVEEGANVVACQHSHCVGAYETYQEQLIVYGQGNFIFDYDSHGVQGKEGMLLSVRIDENRATTFTFVPFAQSEDGTGLRSMAPEEEARFRQGLAARSQALAEEGQVEACWEAYCQSRTLPLLDEVLDHGRLLRRLNAHGAILDLHGKSYFVKLLSIVQNESGVEALNTLLKSRIK